MERTLTFGPLLAEVAAEIVVEDEKRITRHTVTMSVKRAQILHAQLGRAIASATAWDTPTLQELLA